MSEREESWYPIHVFTGHEQKIEASIRRLMETNPLVAKVCHDVKVPMKTVTSTRNNKPYERKVKIMPGYIFVDLDLPAFDENEEKHKAIVYAFKSINGVTGFVNATTARGSKPQAITKQEMNRIREEIGEIKVERPVHDTFDFKKGDEVMIVGGSFEGFSGKIEESDPQRQKLKVLIEVFKRPTIIEIDKSDAEKQ